MIHTVYKTTNILNGQYYIGVHSTNNIDDGYLGSGTYFKSALKKYGKGFFSKEILAIFYEKEHAFLFESSIVTKELVERGETYNLVPGGRGLRSYAFDPINDPRFFSGLERTEKQKEASMLHSDRMKGKVPVNSKIVTVFDQPFGSIDEARKHFQLSKSQYYFLMKDENQKKFSNSKELKDYISTERSKKISEGMRNNKNGKNRARPLIIDGITYNSRKEAMEKLDITEYALYKQIKFINGGN